MTILDNVRLPLIILATVGSGVSAGIFFAFSTFVMQALAKIPPVQGISAMQAINITVINPWFMVVFFAPGIAGILLSLSLLFQWQHSLAPYLLTGSLLYLVGTIGTTVVGNIPLNDALAVVNPDSFEGSALWSKYLSDWTCWNHLRTAAAIFAIAFRLRTVSSI